jgi:hypothetical protein
MSPIDPSVKAGLKTGILFWKKKMLRNRAKKLFGDATWAYLVAPIIN